MLRGSVQVQLRDSGIHVELITFTFTFMITHMYARMALPRVLMYAGDPDRSLGKYQPFTSARHSFDLFALSSPLHVQFENLRKLLAAGPLARERRAWRCSAIGAGASGAVRFTVAIPPDRTKSWVIRMFRVLGISALVDHRYSLPRWRY